MKRTKAITLITALITALATSVFAGRFVWVDENGGALADKEEGEIKSEIAKDDISGVKTLVYHLPFGFLNGDVFLTEGSGSTNSDLFRFANGQDLFVFSDKEPDEADGKADVGVPAARTDGAPVVYLEETGAEGKNGYDYVPANGDPGYPDFAITFHFVSDGAVPEPILSIAHSGANMIILAVGGPPGADCSLLASTNVSASRMTWASLATNQLDTDGNCGFTNTASPAVPRQFFILQLP
jgi:hypothetical protein